MERNDWIRSGTVAVLAVLQVVSSPLTTAALGPSSDNRTISDANLSPVTPASYAFAIWGLIYLGSLLYAVYQLRASQRHREVHRRTGWWLAAAFAASAAWVPIFGSRAIWVSQLVIIALVVVLTVAALRMTAAGPAEDAAERWLFRLPVTLYLGWATLATFAGFGVTFRSLGMPRAADWVTVVSIVLVALAAVVSILVVTRVEAAGGFAFTACWGLLAVAVATYVDAVRLAAVLALVVVLAVLAVRTVRSRHRQVVLLG